MTSPPFSPGELQLLHRARVAHLASIGPAGPHVVPVCYAFDGKRILTCLDKKPKRVAFESLQRVRNIRADPRVALVIDRYDENWSRLAFVLIHGTAEILDAHDPAQPPALSLLRERYPQYAAMNLAASPVIAIAPQRVTSWGDLGSQ